MKKKIKETNETRIILDKIANLTLITSNYLYEQSQNPINNEIASHIDFMFGLSGTNRVPVLWQGGGGDTNPR